MEAEPRQPQSAVGNTAQTNKDSHRKSCGCIKTSEKLRKLIESFPQCSPTPPPTPLFQMVSSMNSRPPRPVAITQPCCYPFNDSSENVKFLSQQGLILDLKKERKEAEKLNTNKSYAPKIKWDWVTGIASLLQLCVTATALGIYYLLYCYMQLVYFTLKSAVFFHQADGPMKITIAILTLTSLYVGFNILMRIERLLGIY